MLFLTNTNKNNLCQMQLMPKNESFFHPDVTWVSFFQP